MTPGPERPKRAVRKKQQALAGRGKHGGAAERRTGHGGKCGNAGLPHIEQHAQRPRECQFRGVGFVQAHAAGIDQQQDDVGTFGERTLEQLLHAAP